MMPFLWFRKLFTKAEPEGRSHSILPVKNQIKAWRKASRKMGWSIKKEEFEKIGEPPLLTGNDRCEGFIGAILSYGFGDDGCGNADPVFSGKVAWEYALKRWKVKTWQCEYIHLDKPDYFRLRPGAPPRPRGFYYAKFQPGKKFQTITVSRLRKNLKRDTGCGPEGIQFLTITHTHFQGMMSNKEIPFMALADYDVAPYGFNDFFDAMQMFFSNGILGLGIGNVDTNYPLFGIPTLRFPNNPGTLSPT